MNLPALRMGVAVLSVTLMVAVCGLALALWSGAQGRIAELRSAVGAHTWQIQMKSESTGTAPPAFNKEPQRLKALKALPGVKRVGLSTSGAKIIGGKSGYATTGVDATYLELRGLKVEKGRLFGRPGEAVVGSALADQLGQTVSDGLGSAKVVGVLASVGARGDIDSMTDDMVFVNLDGYFGLGQADRAIVETTPEQFEALRPAIQDWADSYRKGWFEVVPLIDQYGFSIRKKVADLLSGALGFGVVACILAGLLNLTAFFAARALDGLRALGIRRAAGATRAQVLREDISGALLWALPGLALGLPAAWALARWAGPRLDLPVRLDPWAVLALTGLTLLVVALAALLPARWAAWQPPSLALRGVAARLPRWQAVLTAGGLALGTAGLVVQANTAEAARQETLRAIGTVPAGVFSFNPSLIQGESFTDPRRELLLTPSLLDDLRASEEWKSVIRSSARQAAAVSLVTERGREARPVAGLPGGFVVSLVQDPAALAQMSSAALIAGRWPKPGEVALGEQAAQSLSGTSNVVGKTVDASEQTGGQSSPVAKVKVSGVFRAPEKGVVGGLTGNSVVAPWDEPYRLTPFTFLLVQVRQAEDAQKLADWMNREYGGPDVQPVRPLPPDELVPGVRGALLQLSDVYRLISGALLLLGGAGLTAQLLLMLARRTREIGIRRAVGASRPDIYRQFMAESGGLGLLAALAGVGLGVLATLPVLRAQDVPLAFSPAAMGLALAVGVGVALLFGALPATLATRVSPGWSLREGD